MSTLFDSLTRRRQSRSRRAGAYPTAGHDAVLASLGYRPRRRLGKAARVILVLLAGVSVLIAWAVWDTAARRGAPAQASAMPPRPAPEGPPRAAAATPSIPPETDTFPEPAATPVTSDSPGSEPADPIGTLPDPLPAIEPPPPDPTPVPEPPAQVAAPDDPATPSVVAPPAPDLMSVALYHHRAGDFEKALVAYQDLLRQNEMNPAAHNNLGLLYQEKGLLGEAARAFQRAIILDDGYALAYNNYGVTLLRQRRHDAAAAQFRRVLSMEPRNVDAMVNLALAAQASGARDEARAALLRALAESPRHALAHYNLAVLQDEAGELARAAIHYRAYLEHASSEDPERSAQVRARLIAIGST